MIIGITGKNGSGKGEVADLLKKAGYRYFSLSDAIRIDLEKTGDEITRDTLTLRGNELREKGGSGVLAKKISELIPDQMNAIVDSIRNPEEVKVLKERRDSFLIEVRSSEKIRFERLKSRARESDPTTFDEFMKCEKRESDGKDMIKQQLDLTAKLADAVIDNNKGLDHLHEQTRKVIASISKMMKRPSWDQYFMDIAQVVSLRGNCLKRKVGAVIVKNKRVMSSGYNGTPKGVKNCYEGGCERCNSLIPSGEALGICICSHAEENAIVQAAYHGVSTFGAVIYITYSPCITCAKMIINSGIEEVVYNEAYTIEDEPLSLLRKAGVMVRKISI